MLRRVWPLLFLCAALAAPAVRADDQQPIPSPAHGAKKKKKDYNYDGSEYKAYDVLTGNGHYRFDKDGNPIDAAPAKKVAKSKRKKKKAASPESGGAAPVQYAHAHFASQVATPDAPPPAAAAPRSDGQAAGSAVAPGGSCAGDTCSQPPAGQ